MAQNENENRKVDEPHKFLLDADFIWFIREGEVVELRYGYATVNAHIASDIM